MTLPICFVIVLFESRVKGGILYRKGSNGKECSAQGSLCVRHKKDLLLVTWFTGVFFFSLLLEEYMHA